MHPGPLSFEYPADEGRRDTRPRAFPAGCEPRHPWRRLHALVERRRKRLSVSAFALRPPSQIHLLSSARTCRPRQVNPLQTPPDRAGVAAEVEMEVGVGVGPHQITSRNPTRSAWALSSSLRARCSGRSRVGSLSTMALARARAFSMIPVSSARSPSLSSG